MRESSFRVYHEDCLQLGAREGNRLFDLIYLEPPADFSPAELSSRLATIAAHLDPQGFLLVQARGPQVFEFKSTIDRAGIAFKGDLVWAFRQRSVKSKSLQAQHETILVYSDNPLYFPKREIFAESVVGPSSAERTGLAAQKPVKLCRRILNLLGEYHLIERVLDPMMGSGSMLVAALELGKEAIGFDTSAEAVEIARRRLREAHPASQQLQLEIEL